MVEGLAALYRQAWDAWQPVCGNDLIPAERFSVPPLAGPRPPAGSGLLDRVRAWACLLPVGDVARQLLGRQDETRRALEVAVNIRQLAESLLDATLAEAIRRIGEGGDADRLGSGYPG